MFVVVIEQRTNLNGSLLPYMLRKPLILRPYEQKIAYSSRVAAPSVLVDRHCPHGVPPTRVPNKSVSHVFSNMAWPTYPL